MKKQYILVKSWADSARINDMLQAHGITPIIIIDSAIYAKIIIDNKDLKTAQTICDGWRLRK